MKAQNSIQLCMLGILIFILLALRDIGDNLKTEEYLRNQMINLTAEVQSNREALNTMGSIAGTNLVEAKDQWRENKKIQAEVRAMIAETKRRLP